MPPTASLLYPGRDVNWLAQAVVTLNSIAMMIEQATIGHLRPKCSARLSAIPNELRGFGRTAVYHVNERSDWSTQSPQPVDEQYLASLDDQLGLLTTLLHTEKPRLV